MTPNLLISDLQHWVGQQEPVPDVVQKPGAWTADGVELQDLLGGLRLSGSAFPRDQDEVVVVLGLHGAEDVVRQGVAAKERENQSLIVSFKPQNHIWFMICDRLTYVVVAQKS